MRKLKGNFSLDKDRFELLKKADGEYKTTLFAGYYKKYSIVIDEEHCILENKELKSKEKINIILFLYPTTVVVKYIIAIIGKKHNTKNRLESNI